MNRLVSVWAVFAISLIFGAISAAQSVGRVDGQVLDRNGAPYVGVTVVIKSPESGQSFTVKTDKDGKFSQIGVHAGLYSFNVLFDPDKLNYTEQHQLVTSAPNAVVINFKQIVAEAASNPDVQKAQEAQQSAFKGMKQHFDAGVAAMSDGDAVRKQLTTASADQKSALQDKINTDNQTAITEFQAAEQSVSPKDVKNHALVLGNLALALSASGKYDDAVAADQKAIDLQPSPSFYANQSMTLAQAAVAQNDPAVAQQKLTDAGAACDKAAALDPTPTSVATCWKNMGIVLNNKGDLKDAIPPFVKATTANPKDAQAWYLLGGAYTGTIDTKQDGDKVIYIIPPGTADAYQKCIDADPTGPYASLAKDALDNINQLSGGVATHIGEKKAPPPKKK